MWDCGGKVVHKLTHQEFMDGSLNLLLHTRGENLQTKHLLQFGTDLCLAMEYLHSKSFVHGDLACRNILVTT